jgi:hypothetical protein
MRDHDYPLPGLETLLRDAAGDSARTFVPPSYELIRTVARRRRTARIATAGLALVLAVGAGLAAGTRFIAEPAPNPPAHRIVDDPALRPYRTVLPVLVWTPETSNGGTAYGASGSQAFLHAVFSALGPGDHDFTSVRDLQTLFPDAPVGGPALNMDQSVTKARLLSAAANLKKVAGVHDAGVIEVSGMWFTVSGTSGPITEQELTTGGIGNYDATGFPEGVGGGAGGSTKLADGKFSFTERVTYFGPNIDRATFDLIRTRIAASVHIDPSRVVVKPEHG